ncbi:MAG: hypothetical protein FJ035_09075 [Chloroflexi bacterium]|nr:hypothetical protein [Chloroflexota bacterium]
MSYSIRWLVALGVLVAALLVGSTLVALLAADEQTFAEGTSERAVQDYLRAAADGNATVAYALLTPQAQQRCPELRNVIARDDLDLRATLERTELRDAAATVRVRLAERYGAPPFGGGESSQAVIFELVQLEGAWRIADAGWPYYCGVRGLFEPATPEPARTPSPTPRP